MPGTKIITCAAVMHEIPPHLLEGIETVVLDSSLHSEPDLLRERIQKEIDSTSPVAETILIGFGMCSKAVVGLQSGVHTLVIPLVDDCIALFLGSCSAYRSLARNQPGTYFITKGWVEECITPFAEQEKWIDQYGAHRAERIIRYLIKGYKQIALIDTGQYELNGLRAYAQETAARFSLDYTEIPGDIRMIEQFLVGEWDDKFLIIQPGKKCEYDSFMPMLLGEPVSAQSQVFEKNKI
ncbi:MAG: DUF1638 domain-containing protein [Anaerolineales bacterium]|nr:DUF1638 domain-containing protein [Anaerolineales bacterium]